MNTFQYIIHKLKTKNIQNRNFTYDAVISIGEDCATAGHLASSTIRVNSMPFDWVDGSSFTRRVQLIINEFENWLDKDSLEFYEVQTDVEEDHAFNRYRNTITGLNFPHEFLIDASFDDCYDNVKNKYERRIERFQNSFKNHERILLVFIARLEVNSNEDIIQAVKALNDYSPKARIDLFYIEPDGNMDMNSFRFETINEHIIKFYLNNSPVDFSTHFQTFRGNIPQIIQIFWEFNLITYKGLIKKLYSRVIRKLRKILRLQTQHDE